MTASDSQPAPTLAEMQLMPILSMAALARIPVADLPGLIAKMVSAPMDANLYMSQFHLFSVVGNTQFALEMQSRALELSRIYRIIETCQSSTPDKPGIRLLALMGAGDQSVNTPLDYLIGNSDIQLDLLYIDASQALPDSIPDHDVAIVALGESAQSRPILERMAKLTQHWPRPVLNPAKQLLNGSRDDVYRLLKDIPGLLIPPTRRVSRAELTQVATRQRTTHELLAVAYPITLRPLVSQGGRGLAKLTNTEELTAYLDASDEAEFFASSFIDYRSADGYYRKRRIALIDGMPFICHLAISEHWIVHYGSAGMTDSDAKRCEEARVMSDFDCDFAQRHQTALRLIADRLQLDYVVIDCSETQDGRLLIFEADNRGWIHATDPIDIFQYKQIPMQHAFAAFRTLLLKAIKTPASPIPERTKNHD